MRINEIRDTTSGLVYDVNAFPINKVNIFPVAGNSFNIGLRCKRSMFDAKPVDPNAGTFRLDVVNERNDTTELVFVAGVDITAEDNNVLRFKKPATEMNIDAGVYYYQLVQTLPGEVITLMQGNMTIMQSIAALVPKKSEPLRMENANVTSDNTSFIL